MIKYILCCIVVLTLMTLYLGHKKNNAGIFRSVIIFFLIVVTFSTVYVFTGELLHFRKEYFQLLPFGFAYGPILYMSFCIINDDKFSRQRTVLHLLLFFLAIIIYTINLTASLFNDVVFRSLHYSILAISMGGYPLKIMLSKSSNSNKNFEEEQGLVNSLCLVLLAVSVMIFVLAGALMMNFKTFNYKIPGAMIYAGLLVSVFLVFRYTINNFLSFEVDRRLSAADRVSKQSYEKSALSEELLDRYEQRLYVSMIKQLAFLDEGITLQSLARQLKIPKHHLTQLLSVRIGENFYHYVNRFRVDYACKLINQSVVDLTLEELAYKSGFNSKTSFNRYFKKQIGCTPSEYRNL